MPASIIFRQDVKLHTITDARCCPAVLFDPTEVSVKHRLHVGDGVIAYDKKVVVANLRYSTSRTHLGEPNLFTESHVEQVWAWNSAV